MAHHQHDYGTQNTGSFANMQQQVLCPPESTLWMGDLKPEWDPNFIREAFGENAGDVTNVKMRTTYCFVEFRDGPTARAAMLRVNGMTLANDPTGTSRFNLAFANSPHHMSIEYNLFVNNLAPEVDDVALFRLFGERYMSCRGAKVYRHEDGTSKEQGFVRFTSETDQQKALVELNKHKFHGRELYLKLARPKTRGGPNEKRFGPHSHSGHHQSLMGPAGYGAGGFGQTNQKPLQMGIPHQPSAHLSFQYPRSSSSIPLPAVAPVQAMSMPGMIGAMPFGMAPSGAPLAMANPYVAAQLASNHGVAGFGQTGQQFVGQPLILGYPQNAGFIPQTYQPAQLVHPASGQMIASMGMPYTGASTQLKPIQPAPNVLANVPPPQPVYEDVEPLSADEHNAILYNSSAEFHTALDACRWNPIALSSDTKKKELFSLLHTG